MRELRHSKLEKCRSTVVERRIKPRQLTLGVRAQPPCCTALTDISASDSIPWSFLDICLLNKHIWSLLRFKKKWAEVKILVLEESVQRRGRVKYSSLDHREIAVIFTSIFYSKGGQMMTHGPNPACHLFLLIKFYWNTEIPIHFCIIYSALMLLLQI